MKIKHMLMIALLIIIAGTQTIQAADNLQPISIANFDGVYNMGTYNMGAGYVDEPITFDGSNSYDPDGTIVSYTWDFGDNTSGIGMMLSHIYTMPGNYSIALTVTDDGVPALSNTGFVSAGISIRNQPPISIANFDGAYNMGAYNMGAGYVDEPINFDGSNSYDPDGTIVSYAWDFGDNTSGIGMILNHTYTLPGNYSVVLTVTDDGVPALSNTGFVGAEISIRNQPPVADAGGLYMGYAGEPIQFDGSNSYDPDGTIVSYTWDFGDGASGAGMMVNHTYAISGNYSVVLTVADNGVPSLLDTGFATGVIINQPPVADAGGLYTGYAGETIQFDGSNSYDPDGTIVSYTWDFGDGTSGMGMMANHTYAIPGNYSVVLTVVDNGVPALLDTGFATGLIINQPPVADAGGLYTGYAGETIQFDGSNSYDPDGTIVSYTWDFGDGTSGTGMMANHTYAIPGNYSVVLTVADNGVPALLDTGFATGVIINQPPVADAGDLYTGYAGDTIQFDGSNSYDPDGTIVSYTWDFGDGASGTSMMPNHTYTIPGNYSVNLILIDNEGAIGADNTTAEITVRPQPVDLDITDLHVTKRISLRKIKPVNIRMTVTNNGVANEPRTANVVGMQNSVEVYNENMPVSSDVSVSTTWAFPSYTPTAIGTITWTTTINDDYPDIDEAVSTTKVGK